MEINDKGKAGEEFVNNLAYDTYLKYWCYPGPIDLNGDSKEICDLLVLFQDVCIIVSVKNYDFPDASIEVKKQRYEKKVVAKSSSQLYGAERKLFDSKYEIFIKHPEREPEKFNKEKFRRVYRITINVGEQIEDYALASSNKKGFVSILNRDSFTKILQELDTVKDLIDYLDEREKFLTLNKCSIWYGEEKNILSVYLRNAREFPEEYFQEQENQKVIDLLGNWEFYDNHSSVAAKRYANRNSYFIDRLVNEYVLPLPNGADTLALELMSLDRLERRAVVEALLGIVAQCVENDPDEVGRRFFECNSIGYLMLYFPNELSDSEVDKLMNAASMMYSYKKRYDRIVCLAANYNIERYRFGMFEWPAYPFDSGYAEYVEKLIKFVGWFINEQSFLYSATEYPDE
ncbi:hypothetical protein [Fibrella aestuarina]|nr:hypothetical protein [Fibrella aestuarina]